MELNEAKEVAISLGKPSKMPCLSYDIPASLCKTGARLRKIKGSTCYGCYAFKGNYLYPSVQEGLMKRFDAFYKDGFVEAMIL